MPLTAPEIMCWDWPDKKIAATRETWTGGTVAERARL